MSTPESNVAALRLAAIVESSDDAIISKDLNGVVTSWNRAAERMFGFTAAEAVGKPLTLIVPPDRLAEEEDVLRRLRNNERIEHLETVRQRKDGTLVEVSVSVSSIRDESGAIIGASNITHDITERKSAERDLADLRQRLLAVVEASSAILQSPSTESVQAATIATASRLLTADGYALWRIDPASGAWRVMRSQGISDTFGARLIGNAEAQRMVVPFKDPLVIRDVLAAPVLQGQHEAYRAEGIRSMLVFPLLIGGLRSGTLVFYYRTVHDSSPVEVQTGQALANVAAAAISAADLFEASEQASRQATFLAKAGALLGGSLDHEKTLVAVANLAVPYVADWCAVDLVGEGGQLKRLAVAHVNPAKVEFARMLQERYPDDPNTPGGVHEVIRTGQPTMMSTIPRQLIAAVARDAEHLRLLEELALNSYMCVPLIARGQTLGVFTLVTAESGRHYTAADLQFAQDLAARAAMAIDNASAYQQATEANRLKDDFLATLSHELRTPLNAVLGYARMLNMHILDDARRSNALQVVERNANSLKQIIEDVLDVSRIISGKLRLNVQPVNLDDVVRQAIATVTPSADIKNIRIHSVLDPRVPLVSGDPDRVQQILWNLLTNAVKFTPKGGRVQVQLRRIDSHVEIAVSDTGRGIAREFLPHLFERFRQADSAFSREHGGLGIGLAIVRELVELHGGRIHASSEGPGTGATFTVQLPLMVAHPPPSSPAPRVHPQVDPHETADLPPRLHGLKVLVVDDEEDAVALLKEILEAAGAEVTTSLSPADALAAIATDCPHVLVADIGMPGLDGFELIRRVRQDPAHDAQHLPALALTAYARAQDRIKALASGFQMHIAKPVDPTELVISVAALARRVS